MLLSHYISHNFKRILRYYHECGASYHERWLVSVYQDKLWKDS
jgi:hypothetical protein